MTDSTTPGRSSRSLWLIAYRAGSDAAAKAVMFVITMLAARTLPRADVGMLALASTVGWMSAVVADFGIQMHVAREAAQHPDRIASSFPRWLRIRLWSGAVTLLLALAVLAAQDSRSDALLAGALLALAYAVSGITEYLFHLFRGLRRPDLESTLVLVQRGSLACAAVSVLWWRPTLVLLAASFLASAAGSFVVAIVLAWRSLPPLGADADTRPIVREFLESVAPIGLGLVLSALYFRIDVFLLQLWRGPADVAAYNAVFRVVEAMRLVPAAVLAVMLPPLFRTRDAALLLRVSTWLTLPAILAVLVLWPFSSTLVTLLYGRSYADASNAFRILLLSLPLMCLNYALTTQLIGWHGHRAYAAICAAALAVNVLLNVRLIPASGMDGAAWSTLWTEAVLTLGCVVALTRTQVSHRVPGAAVEVH